MIFDNRNIVVRLNKRRYIALLIYLILMGLLILSDLFGELILGIEKSTYILIFTIIYILYIIYAYLKNYQFFSYNDEGDKLVFRFVSLRPFDNKKQAVEINKRNFKGYNITGSLYNFTENIILKVETSKGIASYPPISISALSHKHKNMLKQSLDQFVS